MSLERHRDSAGGEERELLWAPSRERLERTRMVAFQRWLSRTRGLDLASYSDLWRWSVADLEGFWAAVWAHFDVIASSQPQQVLADAQMPRAAWFAGAHLNWAENLLRHTTTPGPAVISIAEGEEASELSWADLSRQVASLAAELRSLGVTPGDRVAAYLPNVAQTVVAVLAVASIGGVWSCCAPDFGYEGVVQRFRQIEPVVLIAADGYRHSGRAVSRLQSVAALREELPTVRAVVMVRNLDPGAAPPPGTLAFDELVTGDVEPNYEQVPFDHPLWVLFSSGTTGPPKGIIHSHGGILLEALKANALHYDIHAGDRVFIAASTAWVVWNMLVDALSVGAAIVTYEGSPVAGGPTRSSASVPSSRQPGSAPARPTCRCERAGVRPVDLHDLSALRDILSTGSPLPDSTWRWVYDAVKGDLLLGSDSGGTDVATGFVGTVPVLPVHTGEIQGPYLGVDVAAWSEAGEPLIDEVGEMVITQPMPSMPVGFWGDADGSRYREAYFDRFPGVWRHGDWMTETRYGTYRIHGRSDSTINRGGVRLGSAEIYAAVDALPEIAESLVVGRNCRTGTTTSRSSSCCPKALSWMMLSLSVSGPGSVPRLRPGTSRRHYRRSRRSNDCDWQEARGAD